MTKIQKAFCVLLSLCFLVVLAGMPEPFSVWENIYRQLPLYCFLEEQAMMVSLQEDTETSERIIASNAAYLGARMQEENAAAAENVDKPNVTEVPQFVPMEFPESAEEGQMSGEQVSEEPVSEEQVSEEPVSEEQVSEEPVSEEQVSEEQVSEDLLSKETAAEGYEMEPQVVQSAAVQPNPSIDLSPENLADFDYLLSNFFIVDSNTTTSAEQLNAAEFLGKDLTMQQDVSKPQILIYHSHSQETFADSRAGNTEDSIVGVGAYLAQILRENYGYNVMHVTEVFDVIDGVMDRNKAYDYARAYLEPVLEENPSIEVVIDLHRDGVAEGRRLVTNINGKETAQIMFFNGLSYTNSSGSVDYLPNPYIQENLAFSFQLEYQAAQYYPDFYRGIYLAGLRYNLHLRPRSILLEAGAQTNTVQEVKNAMEPFADILHRVLSGK